MGQTFLTSLGLGSTKERRLQVQGGHYAKEDPTARFTISHRKRLVKSAYPATDGCKAPTRGAKKPSCWAAPCSTAWGLSPSLLSWLARSFCFFLLVASSKPRDTLLWPGALVLLDIFSRLDDTNGPPGSVMESGSGVRRFLPGPAILATLCAQTLWQGTSGLKRRESKHGRRSR